MEHLTCYAAASGKDHQRMACRFLMPRPLGRDALSRQERPMCEHRGDAEDCILRLVDTGRLVCVQHIPIPRQRTDDLDLLVAVMQREGT